MWPDLDLPVPAQRLRLEEYAQRAQPDREQEPLLFQSRWPSHRLAPSPMELSILAAILGQRWDRLWVSQHLEDPLKFEAQEEAGRGQNYQPLQNHLQGLPLVQSLPSHIPSEWQGDQKRLGQSVLMLDSKINKNRPLLISATWEASLPIPAPGFYAWLDSSHRAWDSDMDSSLAILPMESERHELLTKAPATLINLF